MEQCLSDVIREHILVLFNEASDVVDDIASVVFYKELWCAEFAGLCYVRVLVLRQIALLDASQ